MDCLRDSLKEYSALRFVVEELQFSSAAGRLALYELSWARTAQEVESRLKKVDQVVIYWEAEATQKAMQELAFVLCDLRPIAGSIALLSDCTAIASDVDFYELKGLALIEEKCRRIVANSGLSLEPMPSLEEPLAILDPEEERLPAFYLSDSYSQELADLRRRIERCHEEEKRDALCLEAARMEDKVRLGLTRRLAPYADQFAQVLSVLSLLDARIAIARWAVERGCTRPEVSETKSELVELWNPEVAHHLSLRGVSFQPVSIAFDKGPTIVTGANMAGKSVLLTSIALAQLLMQYGLYVPAKKASLMVVEGILTSMSDGENMRAGLSSFGAEILRLDELVKQAKKQVQLLALVDEAARTTNPVEGRAIVEALAHLCHKYRVSTIITTHYSDIRAPAQRLRVRGFREERLQHSLDISHLNEAIDYRLEPDTQDDAPQEALRIAALLGVDGELLQYCNDSLTRTHD